MTYAIVGEGEGTRVAGGVGNLGIKGQQTDITVKFPASVANRTLKVAGAVKEHPAGTSSAWANTASAARATTAVAATGIA